MHTIRTDLAAEAHALWRESAGETTRLPGVKAREGTLEGYPVTTVEILDGEGAEALGKPEGVYHTLDVTAWRRGDGEAFSRAVQAVAALLEPMLPEEGPVLVAGLGNSSMTPDALGPRTLDHLLITRHLGQVLPDLRPVAGLSAGVLGATGLEAAEWVRGASEHVAPAAVVLIDALAARGLDRLCRSVQISDVGIIPGSGVGNHRMALDRAALGVPVITVGVPTVADCGTVARDVLAQAKARDRAKNKAQNRAQVQPEWEDVPDFPNARGMFVTPDDIDSKIRELARLLGYGLDLALQPGLALEDLEALLA